MADRDEHLTDNLDKKEKEELESIFERNGIAAFKEKATEFAENWRKTKVHIAFIGRTGSGKSSLINAILGLKADEYGAAKSGSIETTMEPTCYTTEKYDNIVLVDVPGCGTETFPLKYYLKTINIGKYDFVILINSGRFTTDEIELARELSLQKRNIYFVRTKLGQDISNFKKSHKNHGKAEIEEELNKINTECIKNIGKIQWSGMPPPLFLVDSFDRAEFEYHMLVNRMIDDAPGKKQESLVLGLEGLSVLGKKLLMKKEKLLKKRIWRVAFLSGAASACPVPGIGEGVDLKLLQDESEYYRQQLGLEEESFERTLRMVRASGSGDILSGVLRLQTQIIAICTSNGITEFLASSVASNTAENITKFGMPVVGLAFAAVISYGSTVWGLRKILEKMMKTALEINELLSSLQL